MLNFFHTAICKLCGLTVDIRLLRQKLWYNRTCSKRGSRQVARHQPSKLIFAGSNPVSRSFVLNYDVVKTLTGFYY
jgi:hypothetical protein